MLRRDRQQHTLQRSQPPRTVLRRDKTARAIRSIRPTPMPEIAPGDHQGACWHRDFHSVRVRPQIVCHILFRRKILVF